MTWRGPIAGLRRDREVDEDCSPLYTNQLLVGDEREAPMEAWRAGQEKRQTKSLRRFINSHVLERDLVSLTLS